MGYIVDISDLHDNQDKIISLMELWSSAFSGFEEAENEYILAREAFDSEAAQVIREYIEVVHKNLERFYCSTFEEVISLILLYVDGYRGIEESPNGRISEEALSEQQSEIIEEQQALNQIDGNIKSIIGSVSHIVNIAYPNIEPIRQSYTQMSTFLGELDCSIRSYEEAHANDMEHVAEVLSSIGSILDIHKGTNVHIEHNEDIYTYEGDKLYKLSNLVAARDADLILDLRKSDQLYEDYCICREISKARMDKGAARVAEGSLAVLAGALTTVSFSRIAGVYTISEGVAVIVGASSYAAITHGTSDIIEGYHEYEYGKAGDTESVTENYIRDYVYGGRVEYDSVTKLGTAGCSIYLTGVAGYTYSVTYGIPIWQGEVIQGGTALTSGAVDYLVTDHVKDMDINSWVKAYSGKVVASAFCMTSEAAITNKLIPVIQRANTVGIVGSSRSITEIATQDTASIGNSAKSAETVNTGGNFSILDKAKQIANDVKNNNGVPPKGYKGGRTYKNIPLENGAQKLPEGVNYREYDINPYVKGKNRGTERIVIGDDGSVWYTNDHYFTFTQIE